MSDPALSIRGLVRQYQTDAELIEVLSGADLDLMPGELVGLVGPSGSGKSSLLHAAALLEKPNAGSVHVGGIDGLALNERGRTALRALPICSASPLPAPPPIIPASYWPMSRPAISIRPHPIRCLMRWRRRAVRRARRLWWRPTISRSPGGWTGSSRWRMAASSQPDIILILQS